MSSSSKNDLIIIYFEDLAYWPSGVCVYARVSKLAWRILHRIHWKFVLQEANMVDVLISFAKMVLLYEEKRERENGANMVNVFFRDKHRCDLVLLFIQFICVFEAKQIWLNVRLVRSVF